MKFPTHFVFVILHYHANTHNTCSSRPDSAVVVGWFFFQQRKKLINKIWFIYAYVNYNCPDLSWLNWYENDIPYFFAYNIEQQRTRPFEILFFFARFIFYIHSAACIPWILIKKNMDTVQCRCKCLSCQFVLLVHSALNKFIEK